MFGLRNVGGGGMRVQKNCVPKMGFFFGSVFEFSFFSQEENFFSFGCVGGWFGLGALGPPDHTPPFPWISTSLGGCRP